MKENSRCEVRKENFCDGEAGQFLDAFTDGSAGYIHGDISGADDDHPFAKTITCLLYTSDAADD